MRPVRFGVHIHHEGPVQGVLDQVRLAEELGFDSAWVGDSQLIMPEAYTVLGACAVTTSRITLGTGVSNTGTRHPTVIASALAALADLAPGRVAVVMGVGGSSHGALGRKPDTLAELRANVELIGSLLGGESAAYNGRDLRLVWATPERTRQLRLFVHAGGPRGQQQAGEIGYGVELPVSLPEIPAALERVAAGAATSDKPLHQREVCWWNSTCISDDWDVIKEHMAASMSMTLTTRYHGLTRGAIREDELGVDVALAREVAEAYDHVEHASGGSRAAQLLHQQTDEVWRSLTRNALIGPPELVAERIRQALENGPITDIVVSPRLSTERLSVETIMETFITRVVPRVTAAAPPGAAPAPR